MSIFSLSEILIKRESTSTFHIKNSESCSTGFSAKRNESFTAYSSLVINFEVNNKNNVPTL